MHVVILDYGIGNVGSLSNMLNSIGVSNTCSSSLSELKRATHIIIPGVGSFDHGMTKIRSLDSFDILEKLILTEKIPILGICLGMQMFCTKSEEGTLPGLGWVDALVKKFSFNISDLKVPHMQWNQISENNIPTLFDNFTVRPKFYFVHSYYVLPSSNITYTASSEYSFKFCSAFKFDNIFGVQFHPEKSHNYGKQLFKNFLNLVS